MNAIRTPSPNGTDSAAPVAGTGVNAIRVGYARISTRAQDHLSQMEALGAAHCREIVEETASTRADRPKLRSTVERMRAGDTLVIYKPDRVARSVKELLVFLEDDLAPRGINLEILSGICAGTHRPNGQTIADKMLFLVAAMAAEMERDLISERTLDGLAAARAAGRTGGRPSTVTDDVLAAARARRARGQSVTQIARELGVGRSTLYRALENDEPLTPATSSQPAPTVPPGREPVDVDQVSAETSTEVAGEPAGMPAATAAVEEALDLQSAEATGTADAVPATVDQPPATATPRRAAHGTPSVSASAAPEDVPWTSEADPAKRRRWYTDDELAAVQVVKTDRGNRYWVIIAGELLGTVEPHRTARGGRSGWQARHRSGPAVEHFGTGKRPATRDAAVIDLIAAVQHAWNTHRDRRKRDAARRRLER